MEKITRDLKVSGIYCIENKINNKTYIGSSKNLYQRLLKHFALLRHDKHENAHLQSAWNKYGEENFEWFILEFCDTSILTEREQYCLDFQVYVQLPPLEVKSNKQNTKYNNYRHCPTIE